MIVKTANALNKKRIFENEKQGLAWLNDEKFAPRPRHFY